MRSEFRHHALIIGGSMAGLAAVRVLAHHFDRVTLVERDSFPATPQPRKGAPQAHHIHVLLNRGRMLLEQLFPGLQDELGAAGAPQVNWTTDMALFANGVWFPKVTSSLHSRAASRSLLEHTVRQSMLQLPNVTVLQESELIGLIANADNSRVIGGQIQSRATRAETTLHADLVVDASGRSSRAPEWLQALGYAAPTETVVNSQLGYASRCFAPPTGFEANWKVLISRQRPPLGRRGGGIYPIENGQWMVTIGGAGDEEPSTDEEGFMEFIRTHLHPAIGEALQGAQPITPIYGYQRTENRVRHYEQLPRLPDGFVMLGDAVCAFNPVYGQGMSVAALGALALDAWLKQKASASALEFQQQLAKQNHVPWLLATGDDVRSLGIAGNDPATRFQHAYVDRVFEAASHNAEVYRRFSMVTHMMRTPASLFAPRVALAALREALRRDKHGQPHQTTSADKRIAGATV
jgi:2-polyprenyl-6-methoxyphenol hydroxylase-like FAD-dependent oxidoreductase